MTTSPIDKNFWESRHNEKDKYWLTGSSLAEILNYHSIKIEELINKKILEIGVGLGTLSNDVVKFNKDLICCDISEKALENVNENVTKRYLTTDLKNIEPVDVALCHLVFQHCTNEEISRIINDVVLSDDGVFSFQFALLREGEEPNENVKNLISLGSHHFRSLKQIEEMVEKANKKIVWVSNQYDFFYPENFSWLVVKIKNK